jgi:hypothetical protein
MMRRRAGTQSGAVYIEFVLVFAFYYVPLILGLMSVGLALNRSLQVAQITRDIGRMFVRGVDFSQPLNQELITGGTSRPTLPPLAYGLGMLPNPSNRQATGGATGAGVVILTSLSRLSNSCGCRNAGHIVVTRRITIGNRNLLTTEFGNLQARLVDDATGAVADAQTDPLATADTFASVINLRDGEIAYLVETKYNFADLGIPGFVQNPGIYWRSVF